MITTASIQKGYYWVLAVKAVHYAQKDHDGIAAVVLDELLTQRINFLSGFNRRTELKADAMRLSRITGYKVSIIKMIVDADYMNIDDRPETPCILRNYLEEYGL